ncbi:SRPBCC family protein [Actinocatenispora sera]|nr:SRPBCC family protein [Actinocatenispora sera]
MTMELTNRFTVPAPVEQAWTRLLDLPAIAPCLPGATLTGFDGDDFTGTVKVKLGPISLTYKGTGHIRERDEEAHRVVVEASGRETRGPGTATATITATLAADGDDTRVDVTTDLTVTGRPAQFGRGMLGDVSTRLLDQFADCLGNQLRPSAPPEEPAETESPGTTPAAVTPPSPETTAVPEEATPIDLLEVTGAQALARRAAGYALAFVAGALVATAIARLRRRAR